MQKLLYISCLLVIGLTATDAITIVENVTYGRISFILMMFFALFTPKMLLPNNDNYIKILFFFVLLVGITMPFSQYSDVVFSRFLLLVQYLLIVIIVGNVIQSKKQIYNMLFAYCLGCLYIAFSMFFTYTTDLSVQVGELYQLTDEVGNPNENAFLIVYAMILAFVLLKNNIYNSKVINIILYVSMIVYVSAIFSSASRMGFILMIISATIIFISMPKFKIKNLISIALLGIAIFFLVNNYITDRTLERLFTITNDIGNSNLAGREWIWSKAGDMIEADSFNWLVGEGWGVFPYALHQFTGQFKGAHNFYIALFYCTGLLGCLIVLIYFINLSFKLLKYKKKEELFYYLLLLIPLISMISTNWDGRRWWFLIGLFIYKINDLTEAQDGKTISKKLLYEYILIKFNLNHNKLNSIRKK